MEIKGTYIFDAALTDVWNLLMDTAVIAECLPGCKELRPLGGDRYQAELVVAVAAITGSYAAMIAIEDKHPPTSYKLLVEGTGRAGFVKGQAAVSLAPQAGGEGTVVDVTAEGQIGGPVARVGQRLIEGVGRMMMDRFFTCLKGSGSRKQGAGLSQESVYPRDSPQE